MTRMDFRRIGKNFKCRCRTLPLCPVENRRSVAMATVDHHFDAHTNCGDWCRRQHMKDEEKEKSDKCCRSLSEHKVLHDHLKEVLEPHIAEETG